MAIEIGNTEISRRLAMAIGYRPEDVLWRDGMVLVRFDGVWCMFDHTDWLDIGPIAARYKMVPKWASVWRSWQVAIPAPGVALVEYQMHTDPRTCIALAVIEASDRGLL